MAIVTHEMDFARDVSHRVFYMDEGLIYEEGTPEQIFERPQRPKTKAFINRIRSYHCTIASPDHDLYAMNAEIEAFCEKQILPRKTRHDLLLLVEELFQVYRPGLPASPWELTVAYSEKSGRLQVVCESRGTQNNPLEREMHQDNLGLMIIRNLCDSIVFSRHDDTGRLELEMKSETAESRAQG